jgi:hypothetical protein
MARIYLVNGESIDAGQTAGEVFKLAGRADRENWRLIPVEESGETIFVNPAQIVYVRD